MNEVKVAGEVLAEFCRKNHIARLSLFGSVLRDGFRPDSDVDVLVEFEEGHTPGMIGIARMEAELSTLFGRKVDLRTPQDLSRYFRDEVVQGALALVGAWGDVVEDVEIDAMLKEIYSARERDLGRPVDLDA